MAARKAEEPRCIEVSVQYSGSGKVAIKEYGKISSGWSVSMSRRYEVPQGMTEEGIDNFQIERRQHLRDILDPIDEAEFEERYKQRDWND